VFGAVADEGGGAAGEADPLSRLLLIEVDAESAAVALAATGLHHRGYRIPKLLILTAFAGPGLARGAGLEMPDVLGEIVEVVPAPQPSRATAFRTWRAPP